MITNFKIFENLNQGEPGVGDFVICEEKFKKDAPELINFMNNNIGTIIGIVEEDESARNQFGIAYKILYENVPSDLKADYFHFIYDYSGKRKPLAYRKMRRIEINYWSKDLALLEDILAAKKFNL